MQGNIFPSYILDLFFVMCFDFVIVNLGFSHELPARPIKICVESSDSMIEHLTAFSPINSKISWQNCDDFDKIFEVSILTILAVSKLLLANERIYCSAF